MAARRCRSTLAIPGVWGNTEKVTSKPSGLDPAVTERIGEFLRSRGLRREASRIPVLAVLEPVNGHLSGGEIHPRLAPPPPPGAPPPALAAPHPPRDPPGGDGGLHGVAV